jgi:hypothetical protein
MQQEEFIQLPSYGDFVEMLKRARKATSEGVAEATRKGSPDIASRSQAELALWDKLILKLSGPSKASPSRPT